MWPRCVWALAFQVDLPCSYVRVQTVLAVCILLFDAAEKSAVAFAVDLCVYLADADGDIYIFVVPLVSRVNRDLSGVEFDVFISDDFVYRYLPSRHLGAQIGLARHLDMDLDVVVVEMFSIDGELGLSGSSRQAKMGVSGAIGIVGLTGDTNPLLICADYLDARRP